MLVDLDPQGRAGQIGRDLLSRLPVGNLAPDKILGLAETAAQKGDFGRALDLCRRAREVARGARDEQEVGGASFLLIGNVYRAERRLLEASLAFDLGAELYPRSTRAPGSMPNCPASISGRISSAATKSPSPSLSIRPFARKPACRILAPLPSTTCQPSRAWN